MSLINSFLTEEQRVGLKKGLGVAKPILFFILKLSFIPVIVAILLGYYFRKKEIEKDSSFSTAVSFVESKKINSPISSAISSQLNLIRGGQENSEGVIDAIVKSDRIILDAFFSDYSSSDSSFLINKIADVYYPDNSIRFSGKVELDSMNINERNLYKSIFGLVTNEKTGLFQFESSETVQKIFVNTKNEILSYNLANNIYNSLANFYDSNKTESIDNSLKLLIRKRDSTKGVLKSLNRKLAKHNDKSGLYRTPSKNLEQVNLVREIYVTEIQYNQFLAQVETFEISNTDGNESYFQKLNYPILPLAKSKKEVFKQTVIGGAIGFVVGFVFIILIFVFIEIIRLLKAL